MADKPKIEVVASGDDVPGGLMGQEAGTTWRDAAEGLIDDMDEGTVEDAADPVDADEAGEEEDSDDADEDSIELDEGDDADDEDGEDEVDEELVDEDGDDSEEGGEDLYEVTLPGGEKSEVTLDELLQGYSRTADYTRKRQRDAAEHSEAVKEAHSVRDKYLGWLDVVKTQFKKMGPQAPDPELRHSNPGEYAAQVAEFNEFEKEMGSIDEASSWVQQEISEEDKTAFKAHVQEEWGKAVEFVPEWSDTDVATKELTQMRDHALELGFSEQEVDSLSDHRLLLMLRRDFERSQTKGKVQKKVQKKRRKASKTLEPGSTGKRRTRGKPGAKRARELGEVADQTGSVRDAARAIEALLDD
jgi:hypothetical protein